MKYEGLVFGIPGSGCFQPSNIASMAKLSLCIATDCFVVFRGFEKQFVLLGSALAAEGCLDGGVSDGRKAGRE